MAAVVGIETGVRVRTRAARIDLVLTKGLVSCRNSGYQSHRQVFGGRGS